MNKLYFQLIIMIFSLLFVSTSFAAELRWGAVEDTGTCIIKGYNVYYGTDPNQLSLADSVEGQTSYNIDQLNLEVSTTYYFSVSAYSTTNDEGPRSTPISYMDTPPNITGYPSIDFTNNLIEVTFNESNMQGAATTSNYSFNQGILEADSILRINKTYQLRLGNLPEHAIITMTLSDITDNTGNALTSNSITINDNDNDNMADDWEADYGITSPSADTDSDGLQNNLEYINGTNPNSEDSDNDGMDDNWEVQNSLNPLVDDANGDFDNDGISNFDEYNGVTSIPNSGPEKPVLNSPTNSSTNIGLTPELTTNTYVNNENNAHAKTQWQISTDQTFANSEDFVFEIESYDNLTELTVPEFILDPDQTYYWRVKFFDIPGGSSDWSDPFTLTTVATNTEDPDEDGVPNIQQVTNGIIDLDNDGTLDIASTTYKMVNYEDKSLSMEASDNVAAIDCLKAIDPNEITDTVGKPANLPVGLLQFKISVNNEGDSAEIKIYFSEPVGNQWYKYDLTNGWTEYSADYPANVQFSADGKSVTLTLVDGGAGDSDGVANGIIVDPSGPGAFAAAVSSGGGGAVADSGGSGCFIATAAFGSNIEKHVQVLKDFRDEFLLKTYLGTKFVRTYYKYSPPIADFIAEHETLRSIVRVGLMPLIAFGYIVVHASPFAQSIMLFLIIGMAAIAITRTKQYVLQVRNQNLYAA